MLVKFHKGFILEGEATFKEKKHFWSKPEFNRRKIYENTCVYGICDDSELDSVVERLTEKRLAREGWGDDFSGWRMLTYEESLDVAKRKNWDKGYVKYRVPDGKVTIETLDSWTVEKAAKKLNGKQFAQYCRDYGITIKEAI